MPLLVATIVFLVSLPIYGIVTAGIINLVVVLLRKGYDGAHFWKNVAVMIVVSVLTALMHLMQIALWALAILLCGATATFADAFYCSAQNYTSLGYGDFVFSKTWRLLGPLEAINGLLLFGLSTAVMFAIMSRLLATRLHLSFEPVDGRL